MQQSAERHRTYPGGIARTTERVAHALRRLSDSDLLRLEALARLRARGLPAGIGWSDLLNEAIRRALDGSRPWPPGVPLLAFLAQIMRSIWSELCRRDTLERSIALTDRAAFCCTRTDEIDPERIVSAAQALAEIHKLFSRDPAALNVIAGLADGRTAQEIRDIHGISETEYDTIRKRIRRTLLRQGLVGGKP
jgi:DNA-directed RNA polymerase specialized sigma24 family protein